MLTEMRRGAVANLAVGASAAAYGSVLGMLAAQKGLTWVELMYMNVSVFAGAAQFVMIDMWNPPLPLLEMTLAVFVINLRYLLIGASLEQLFQGAGIGRKLRMMHLVADENWAITIAEQRKGSASIPFLFGGGVFLLMVWSAGTLIGLLGGGFIAEPEKYALDFAFTAVFTALAVGLFQGKRDIMPWMVTIVLAFVSYKYLPGKWYVMTGGVGGAIAAMAGTEGEETNV